MTENGWIVASDLNGTLTTGSPVLAVARWLAKNQPDSYPPLFELRTLLSYLQVKAGLKEIDTWGKEAMSKVLGLVQSPSLQTLGAIMEYVVETELWPKRRVEPISLLQEYRHQGANLYIISAAYQPAVDKFARKISPEGSVGIGTEVVLNAGSLALADQLNSRDRKISNLLAVIGPRPIEIALGDTFADIPLLEHAGTAIAVHPDRKLKNAAREHGWRIID